MSADAPPFITFGAPDIGAAEITEVNAVLAEGWLGTGPRTAAFEQAFAAYKGLPAERVVALNSCTAALHLALVAGGIGPGDEVITTPLTFAATVNAILHAGATPVLADIDALTMNIDPRCVAQAITPRTRAIVPVHFAGLVCDMTRLRSLATAHGLLIIEDCAHAVEASWQGQAAGTLGDYAAFSFYVTKNVTSGEGGMLIAPDTESAQRVRMLALHGMSADAWKRFSSSGWRHYDVVACGFKYNMMDLQAAIGLHQLARVETNWQARDRLWQQYRQALGDLPIDLPPEAGPGSRHARHLFTVGIDAQRCGHERDAVLQGLMDRRIGAGVHYRALPEHSYYQQHLGWRPEHTPHATTRGRATLSLPFAAHTSPAQALRITSALRDILSTPT